MNTLEKTINEFRLWLYGNTTLKASTINLYVRTINAYLEKYNGEINIVWMNEFITDSFRKTNSPYKKYSFKFFLKFLKKSNFYEKLVKVKEKPRKNPGKYISDDMVKNIIKHIKKEKYRDIAVIQYATGARSVGVLTLEEQKIDIDYKPDVVRIWMNEKRNKEVCKFISRDIFEKHLKKYLTGSANYLFLTKQKFIHREIAEEDLERSIRNEYQYYLEALTESANFFNMKSFGTHNLRRNFAERLKRAGANQNTVKKALGHSDIRTTQLYYDEDEVDVEQAMLGHQGV